MYLDSIIAVIVIKGQHSNKYWLIAPKLNQFGKMF